MTGDSPVCLVTGGASGIGAACVASFVAAGYRVVFGDIQVEKGEALARRMGDSSTFVRLDVRSEDDFADATRRSLERWGRLDCVVNNAVNPAEGVDCGLDDALGRSRLGHAVCVGNRLAAECPDFFHHLLAGVEPGSIAGK